MASPKASSAPTALALKLKTIDAQPSWVIRSSSVEMAVTQLGAHMAPVTFRRDTARPVQPYYISPWQREKRKGLVPVLAPLRGDFFCLPFGGNGEAYRGEQHPPHGETSGEPWSLLDHTSADGTTTLALGLEPKVRPGQIRREFILRDGHDAVYTRTVVSGFLGRTPFAHHACLRVPEQEGAMLVSTSPFDIGRTYPVMLANPAGGEYQSLAVDAPFRSLSRVPSLFKGEGAVDCSAFPVRPGFCDLIQQFEKPRGLSWVAAVDTVENWLWFAIKHSAQMPGRLFWIENQGRHSTPWDGRNRTLGIEDGCMYFDRGVATSSRANPISREGIATYANLTATRPLEVRYLQGAISVPKGFGRVKTVRFGAEGAIFTSETGKRAVANCDPAFLQQ